MELILLAVALMILLTALDTGLWPKAVERNRPAYAPRLPRRGVPHRRPRHPTAQTGHRLSLAGLRRSAPSARWWWE